MDYGTRVDILIYSIMAFVVLIFLVPLIYGVVKKKYWILISEGIVILLIALCCYLFPTEFPYVDPWITGKTKEEIVAVYGQPDGIDWGSVISYDLGRDSYGQDWNYYIHFDENGVAFKVEKAGPIGG